MTEAKVIQTIAECRFQKPRLVVTIVFQISKSDVFHMIRSQAHIKKVKSPAVLANQNLNNSKIDKNV